MEKSYLIGENGLYWRKTYCIVSESVLLYKLSKAEYKQTNSR